MIGIVFRIYGIAMNIWASNADTFNIFSVSFNKGMLFRNSLECPLS